MDTLFKLGHTVLWLGPSIQVGPTCHWLLCSPLNPRSSPSVQADLSADEGLPWLQESLLFFSSPLWGMGYVLLPFLILFPSFFGPTKLCGDLSCPFKCLQFSASV